MNMNQQVIFQNVNNQIVNKIYPKTVLADLRFDGIG